MSRYLQNFPEEIIIKVLRAYLVTGDSHRTIQRNILGIPAPARGGGFIAMDILHHFDIKAEHKGILRNKESYQPASILLSKAIDKVTELTELEVFAATAIKNNTITQYEQSITTEVSVTTKQRIGQSALREFVLHNYANKCALCSIHQNDLLICSHIIPWSIDEENRLNPANAIIFCSMHDRLFDKGYFSLNEQYEVILSTKSDAPITELLRHCDFKLPERNKPNLTFLKFHREEICKIDGVNED